MGESTHRIRRQIIEFEIADEADARPLQERISRLHHQRIAHAIERACDAIAGGRAVVRFDRVAIDLGEFEADELEETIVERIGRTLEASLRGLVDDETGSSASKRARAPTPRAAARRVEGREAALEEITLFVRTGALPWWTSERDSDYLQRRAQELHTASPGAIVGLVRGLVAAGERQSLARLVAHLDDSLLSEVATRAVAPARLQTLAHTRSAKEVVGECVALLGQPGAIAEYSPRARRNLVWGSLLWLAGTSSTRLAGDLRAVELYERILEAVTTTVGRALPGAIKQLQQRLLDVREAPGVEVSSLPQKTSKVDVAPTDAPRSTNERPRASQSAPSQSGDGAAASRSASPSGDDVAASRSPIEDNVTVGSVSQSGRAERRASSDLLDTQDGGKRLKRTDAGGTDEAVGRPPVPSATRQTPHLETRDGARETSPPRNTPATHEGVDDGTASRTPVPSATRQTPYLETRDGARETSPPRNTPATRQGVDDGTASVSVHRQDKSKAGKRATLTGESAAAIEAWVAAAEDAVAVLGAGPPGIEGRRRLDHLIATLVTLAPLVAHWPEAERGPRLLHAVDPKMSSRNLEFSLMALVGGAASRLKMAEVIAVRHGLEALLERAQASEGEAVAPEGQVRTDAAPHRGSRDPTNEASGRQGSTTSARGEGDARTVANRLRVHTHPATDVQDRTLAQPSAQPRQPRRADDPSTDAKPGPEVRATVPQKTQADEKSRTVDPGYEHRERARDIGNTAPNQRISPPVLPRLASLPQDALYIDDAGMVLLSPFIPHFFRHLGLVDERRFVDAEAQIRATALLRVAVTGKREVAEYQLPMAKVLSGLAIDALAFLDPEVGEEEETEAIAMLEAVIERAPILKRMSVAGLRGSFLLRPGVLRIRDGAWLLQVERQGYDVVLDRFPWSFSWVKLPWMDEPLQVEW